MTVGASMRKLVISSMGIVAAATAVPALAQQADPSISSYLCTFAGKCDATAPADGATMAAPETKGFRLAAPQPATTPAPNTKSFRLAGSRQATPPASASTAARSARYTRDSSVPATGRSAAALVREERSRPAAMASQSAASQAALAGTTASMPATGTRADLMLSFGYNSDRLTPGAQGKARTFAQALMMPELKDKRFLIEGHTDSSGSRALNLDLSRRRAQSVVDFLVAQGVDQGRVEVKGVGPDEPLPGHTAAAVANRRVEAVLLS